MAELSQTFGFCPIPDMPSQPERRAAHWDSPSTAAHRGPWTGGPAWGLDTGLALYKELELAGTI